MIALARRNAAISSNGKALAGRILAVKSMADVHALSRIVDVLAVRDILPEQLSCQHAGVWLMIDIQLPATSEEKSELILHKIRSLPCVLRASIAERGDR